MMKEYVHRYINFWVGKLVEKSFIFLGVEEHPKFPKKKFKPKTCTFVEFRALLVKNIL